MTRPPMNGSMLQSKFRPKLPRHLMSWTRTTFLSDGGAKVFQSQMFPPSYFATTYFPRNSTMRYYLGAGSLSAVVPPPAPEPPPVQSDWTLTLISADGAGNVTFNLPTMSTVLFSQPDNIVVAYLPGTGLDSTLTAAQLLALPGIATVTVPFNK